MLKEGIFKRKVKYVPEPGEVGYGKMVYTENPLTQLKTCTLDIVGSNFDVIEKDYINIPIADQTAGVTALVIFKSWDTSGNNYVCVLGKDNSNLYNYVFTYNTGNDQIRYLKRIVATYSGSILQGAESEGVYYLLCSGAVIYKIDWDRLDPTTVGAYTWRDIYVTNDPVGTGTYYGVSEGYTQTTFNVNEDGDLGTGAGVSGMTYACAIRYNTNNKNGLAYYENSFMSGYGWGSLNLVGNIIGESIVTNPLRTTFVDKSGGRYYILGRSMSLIFTSIVSGQSYISSVGPFDIDVGTPVRGVSIYNNDYILCNRTLIPRSGANASAITNGQITCITRINANFISPYVLIPF
jgi:hypothetical protein